MSKETPVGYRRTDPDETMGRWLYRQFAEAEARRSISMARKVVTLRAPPPDDASGLNPKETAP